MMITGILITICIELLLPVLMGLAVSLALGEIRSKLDLLAQSFVYGQIIIFALFQPIFVFAILKDYKFSKGAALFGAVLAVVLLTLIVITFTGYRKDLVKTLKLKNMNPGIWGIAALVILGIMIVMSFLKAYYDGDDSYYVAAAAEGINSDSMYKKEPYTGDAILSPYRYLFAPFPMWIAFLSKLSGIKVAAVAHTMIPWCMILFVFAVMYIMSGYLLKMIRKNADCSCSSYPFSSCSGITPSILRRISCWQDPGREKPHLLPSSFPLWSSLSTGS